VMERCRASGLLYAAQGSHKSQRLLVVSSCPCRFFEQFGTVTDAYMPMVRPLPSLCYGSLCFHLMGATHTLCK